VKNAGVAYGNSGVNSKVLSGTRAYNIGKLEIEMLKSGLEKLGYDSWMQNSDAFGMPDDFCPARVVEVNRNGYMVATGEAEMAAELSGKFMFDAKAALDFPTVGDWVAVQTFNENTLAIVHSVLPRRTLLKRKEPGKRIDFQLIAANIDYGLVMQSACDPNFNLLDRYFVMLNEAGIQPIAVFSKTDLATPEELEKLRENMDRLGCRHVLISNVAEGGTGDLARTLESGKTYCLLGQSGVGKTSLLNRFLGAETLKVGEVREKDGKGRHTTARRQLICLESGGIFIDTPGIRELGNFDIGHGLEETFKEFTGFASACRYRDCTHTHEQGCAVIAAVESGDIDESRYRNYLKLKKESEFYDMSYQERRKKDKAFGKMVKNYKKLKAKS
jgi:ribosome biogenesis GTPase / thiamine phosphate phosphatase